METGLPETTVGADYLRLATAVLPVACGLCCRALDGTPLFAEVPSDAAPLPSGAAVGRIATDPRYAVDVLAVAASGRPVATLAVWTPSAAAIPPSRAATLLAPVAMALGRELGLGFQVLEGRRRLAVQAAEERLLHAVERLVHARGDCTALLADILRRCRAELPVATAVLLLPDLGIQLAEGNGISSREAHLLYADVMAGALPAAPADPDESADRHADVQALPVCGDGRRPRGILVLSGFAACEFSPRRLARVLRYVVSQIESLLARDYDALTGLPVWTAFERQIVEACGEADPGAHAALFFDIDQLHVVNEGLGQQTGDDILVAFAGILRSVLQDHTVARLTGDHFAALLRDTPARVARRLAATVAARLAELEYRQGERVHRPTVSAGVALLQPGAETATTALAMAQVACQAAKDRGRGRVELYETADQSIVRRLDDIQLVGYLRSAIDAGRLVLLAQPIMPTRAQPERRPYCEVLVRLLGDDGRQLSPAEFISAAERYQLMEDLDRWVVAETLRLVAPFRGSTDPRIPRLAVNLSGHSLGSESFLAFVQDQVLRSGFAPELLCFEITESVAIANMQRAQLFMHTLRRMGCHFSLDDFGTGLSSFAYLKLFPVDTLKIDGSFVRDLGRNEVSQSVVAAISEVARVMRLETVAEFVQDEATVALLARLGITWAQGYHLGAPAPLADRLAAVPLSVERSSASQSAR